MKKNINEFNKKVQSDSTLRDKVEQLRKDYIKQIMELSQEVDTPLAKADLGIKAVPLTDSEIEQVTGGSWSQSIVAADLNWKGLIDAHGMDWVCKNFGGAKTIRGILTLLKKQHLYDGPMP